MKIRVKEKNFRIDSFISRPYLTYLELFYFSAHSILEKKKKMIIGANIRAPVASMDCLTVEVCDLASFSWYTKPFILENSDQSPATTGPFIDIGCLKLGVWVWFPIKYCCLTRNKRVLYAFNKKLAA